MTDLVLSKKGCPNRSILFFALMRDLYYLFIKIIKKNKPTCLLIYFTTTFFLLPSYSTM